MQISNPPPTQHPWGQEATPYEQIGGESGVRLLVERFYDEVDASSPVLRAMLPRDMSVSREKLFEFLSGWMGGPPLYVEKHGHPALRMRHFPFKIDVSAAKEWMRCMVIALEDTIDSEQLRDFLTAQLSRTAQHLINAH